MGFFDWLRHRNADPDEVRPAAAPSAADAAEVAAPVQPRDEWEPVAPFVPVDAAEHRTVVVAATAIAAGDRPESQMVVRRVSAVNPEHRLVSCIASAIAAGSMETSQLVVKNIYKKVTEEDHAA